MRLLEITLEGAVSALELRKAKKEKKDTRIGAAMSREETFAQSFAKKKHESNFTNESPGTQTAQSS